MSTKRGTVLICPGFGADENMHWYQELAGRLNPRGFETEILRTQCRWSPFSRSRARGIADAVVRHAKNGPIYLIGHSIAGPAILRFLANNKRHTVEGVLLVAPVSVSICAGWLPWWPTRPEKVIRKVRRFGVVFSRDDPVVEQPQNAEWYEGHLLAICKRIDGFGHFCSDMKSKNCPDGVLELPSEAMKLLSWVLGLPTTKNPGG